MRVRTKLLIGLLVVLAGATALWATDGTWIYPFPTLAGLNQGDILVVSDAYGHVTNNSRIRLLAGTAPTCSTFNCGTDYYIKGNDSGGIIRFATGATTGPVMTFNTAWAAAPACQAVRRSGTAANVIQVVATTTTTMTLTVASGAPGTGDEVAYFCMGVA